MKVVIVMFTCVEYLDKISLVILVVPVVYHKVKNGCITHEMLLTWCFFLDNFY